MAGVADRARSGHPRADLAALGVEDIRRVVEGGLDGLSRPEARAADDPDAGLPASLTEVRAGGPHRG
jgi:hypothetical protein